MRIDGKVLFLALGLLTAQARSDELRAGKVWEQRPNVILILADDLAPGDFASRNKGLSKTPHLDRRAGQSVWFNQAYSASCVCAPARAALLTGSYTHRTGVVTLNMNRYPDLMRLKHEETTIAEVLKASLLKLSSPSRFCRCFLLLLLALL